MKKGKHVWIAESIEQELKLVRRIFSFLFFFFLYTNEYNIIDNSRQEKKKKKQL